MQRFIYIFFHFVRRSRTLFLLTLFCTFVASRKKEEGFVGFREEHEHVGGRHEVSRCCWLLRENIARSDFETISKTTFLSFILSCLARVSMFSMRRSTTEQLNNEFNALDTKIKKIKAQINFPSTETDIQKQMAQFLQVSRIVNR